MKTKERKLVQRNIASRLERLQIILASGGDREDEISISKEDESERIDALNHSAMDEALINIARQEKARLLANIEWIKSEEGGMCQQCKTAIPIQRLLMVPTTRFCVDCAAVEEN